MSETEQEAKPKLEPFYWLTPFYWMTDDELRETVQLLMDECDRLRRELDEVKGIIR